MNPLLADGACRRARGPPRCALARTEVMGSTGAGGRTGEAATAPV
jgi:hypothetical protein